MSRRRAGASRIGLRAMLCAVMVAGGASHASVASELAVASAAASVPERRYRPVDEMDRLEYIARADPEAGSVELQRFLDATAPADPRRLHALFVLGGVEARLHRKEALDEAVRRIEAMQSASPLAEPAAMMLRGLWLQQQGGGVNAERELTGTASRMPADAPGWLRTVMLDSLASELRRGGHVNEAMALLNTALVLADDAGPVWRRVDLRVHAATTLVASGQGERAAEYTREQWRLASESGDDLGMSTALTMKVYENNRRGCSAADASDDRLALTYAQRSGSSRLVALATSNLAACYLDIGDYQAAYDLSRDALASARATDSAYHAGIALAVGGDALILMHRKDEGLALARQSLVLQQRYESPTELASHTYDLGRFLEKSGYAAEALAVYQDYRRISFDSNRTARQRALIEQQENFAADRRQHQLDLLAREGKLQDELIRQHRLEIKVWVAAASAGLLMLLVIAFLARRLRVRNGQLALNNERLRIHAEVDPLTGVSNRHHLEAILARRPGPGLDGALYLLDIDHFKRINDRCGHAGGDAVLVEVARRLRATLRDRDLVVRWGGEEFVVLVPSLPQAEAESLAQRLLAALADLPVTVDGRGVRVTASIGFGVFPLKTGPSEGELVVPWARAVALVDAAMYRAKSLGRNAAVGVRAVRTRDVEQLGDVTHSLQGAAAVGLVDLHVQHGPVEEPAPAEADVDA